MKILNPKNASWSLTIFLTSISIMILFNIYILTTSTHHPEYLDEKLYISCGLKYLHGTSPTLCNPEHPPLGKYIIGAATAYHVQYLYLVSLFIITIFFSYLIFSRNSEKVGILASLLLSTDTLFLNVYRHFLLDPPSMSFSLISLFLFIYWYSKFKHGVAPSKKRKNVALLLLSGIFSGLALSCKWQSLYVIAVIPLLLLWYLIKNFLSRNDKLSRFSYPLVAYVGGALTSYILTFAPEALTAGFYGVINHNLLMMHFMSLKHPLLTPLSAIGFLKLMTKAEYWRLGYKAVLIFNVSKTANTVIYPTISNIMSSGRRGYLVIYVGLGGLSWYGFMPSLLVLAKKGLEGNLSESENILILTAFLSLINVLYGPLDWYYIYTLPFLYFSLVDVLLKAGRKGEVALLALLLMQLTQLTLILAGLIPWKISLVI